MHRIIASGTFLYIKKLIVALWFPDLLYRAHQRMAIRTNHFKIFKISTDLLTKNFSILVWSRPFLAGVSPPQAVPLRWLVRPFGLTYSTSKQTNHFTIFGYSTNLLVKNFSIHI